MSRPLSVLLAVLALWQLLPSAIAQGEPPPDPAGAPSPVVRLAELEIDPVYVDAYNSALTEEIETSIRVEPGVLTLYAVAIKDDPTRIRIFETYANMDAYNAHIQSPHFLKYKTGTQHMIRNLNLIETDPIALGARPG
jgi:quinol monooxygenase YgiN